MRTCTRAASLAASLSAVLVIAMTGSTVASSDLDCNDVRHHSALLALDTARESPQQQAERLPATPVSQYTPSTTPPSVPAPPSVEPRGGTNVCATQPETTTATSTTSTDS